MSEITVDTKEVIHKGEIHKVACLKVGESIECTSETTFKKIEGIPEKVDDEDIWTSPEEKRAKKDAAKKVEETNCM